MALFIIGLIINIALIALFLVNLKKFINVSDAKVEGKNKIKFLGLTFALGLTNILSSYGLVLMNNWTLSVGENILLIFGSFVFGISILLFAGSFGLYYWKPTLDKKQRKVCRILSFVSVALFLIGLWILSEGIANQDIYPLVNGINTSEGFTLPNRRYPNGLSIKWYGIIIVFGALICYFITDHYTYKKFGEHGLIDTLFLVSFIFGLLGARLWYCLILEKGQYLSDPITIFTNITDGGLAIQGGALLGMASGIAFVLIFRKYIDVRFLMDVAIPTILIAQAIGRWGNFFNQEVYGGISPEWLTNLLPTIVRKNMIIYGAARLPLFLIESIINIGGFCLIRFGFGKLLKFRIGTGYQASLYPIWYGLVRVVLEPLRDGFTKNVGHSSSFGYMQSWIVGFVMIGIGVVMLTFMIILHKVRMAKGLEDINGDKIKTQN